MLNSKIEQRVNLKFLVKLKKSATESFRMLTEAYGEDCMSRARVFEWHKRFSEGREDVEDDDRPGRPRTSRTDENVEKINRLVREDRRLSVRMIADMVHIDRECVRKILHEELNMRKVCAKVVPRVLTVEQKESRRRICLDILERIQENPNFLDNVITCDETWIFQYDPETKKQSMHWKTPSSPRLKKARQSKSKFKAMLICFFDIKGVILAEWVPEGQMVNQYYYRQVLETLRERVRRRRPEMWKNGFILHQDNAPAHNALTVKQFLTSKAITVLEHPPYSPDLAPCDFFLFPKIKTVLKGTRFESVDAVKEKTTALLRGLTEDDWQHCFSQWKTRMRRCVDAQGEYTEGDKG